MVRVRVATCRVAVTLPGVTVACSMAGDRATLFRPTLTAPGVTVPCRMVRLPATLFRVTDLPV